jgi:hypothetical protein
MVRIRRLSVTYLDLELPLGDDFHVRIVERPGRWMSSEDIERMVDELRVVAASTLAGVSLDYGVLTGDSERLDDAIITILYKGEARRPVGFNALTLMTLELRGRPEEVLHTGLVMVDPAFRSMGFSWVLSGLSVILTFFHRQLRSLWITSVTQVPAAFGLVAESFDDVFPAGPQDRRSYRHLEIARQVMDKHRHVFGVAETAGFDQERFVILDAYTGGSDNLKKSFAQAAKHRNEGYNTMCREWLDYERGDDFLQVGQWNLATARRYLLRTVPRRSLASILSYSLFLLAGAILVPVLQWFAPGTQLGDLRPWGE